MKLESVLKNSKWEKVQEAFIIEYPDPKFTDHMDLFKEVYIELGKLEPLTSDFKIRIERIPEINEQDKDFISVSGIRKEHDFSERYGLSITMWEKWLGMEMEHETIRDFNYNEIIAYCLYEMTFYGFDQETIADWVNKREQ